MPRWRATLSYDGTPYHGWQVQPARPTVQGTLAAAIQHITGESVLPQGSGRTDSGVHALGQVASFDLASPIPPPNLNHALNRSLPPSIRILSLAHAAPDFHARHSALRKTYEYRILPRIGEAETICPPFLAPYIWPCPRPLRLDLLNQAAAHILGTHDFTSFAAVDADRTAREPSLRASPPVHSGSCPRNGAPACHATKPIFPRQPPPTPNTRTIHAAAWTWSEATGILTFRITGSGFLHHMVRNLVGAFVECGAMRLAPDHIPRILAARNRAAAGPTAPPQGLFLAEVEY